MTGWKWKKFDELTVHEFYDTAFLRQQVFILEQQCRYYDLDQLDEKAWHLLGYEEGKLVAYLRAFPPGIKYPEMSIGRVATAATVRGQGIGKELMVHALSLMDRQFDRPAIRISAQSYLKRFYESLGFVVTGQEYMDDGIPHIEMLRSP